MLNSFKKSKHSAVLIGELGHKKSLYEVLGLPDGAGIPEIKMAYREQISDLKLRESTSANEQVEMQIKLLTLAYETLTIDHSRILYNKRIDLPYIETPEEKRLNELLETMPDPEDDPSEEIHQKNFKKLAFICIVAGFSLLAIMFSSKFVSHFLSIGIR